MTTLYFNVKGGLKTGNIVLDAATGNVTGIENATLGNLVTANYFTGNGSSLSGLNASNLASGTISSGILGNSTVYIGTTGVALNRSSSTQSLTGVSIDGSANYATYAGTVTTADQPNITSVGTLASLGVTANITAGNISSQGAIDSTGNVTAPFFIGNVIGNISGTITVPGNNTSVLFNQSGNAGASDNLQFNYSTSVLTVTGNIIASNANLGNLASANYISGNGSLLTSITGANVTGEVSFAAVANSVAGSNVSGQVGNALIAGTVFSNAQPNITSVGTLTDLTVSGNVFAPAIVQNASTYDTRISLSSAAGIIEANTNGNVTQFLPGGQIRLSGAATIYGGTLDGSQLVLGTTQTDLVQNRGGNVTVQTGTGGTTADTWTFAQGGNLIGAGNVNAGYFIGNGSQLTGVVATTATTATTAGTVTTNAQPNITSTGTLAGVTIIGNVDVTGDFNVTGNLNYTNVNDLVIGDPLIYLGANNTGNLYDLGFVSKYNDGTVTYSGLARNHGDGVWTIFDDLTSNPTTVIDWGNTAAGSFKAGNITAGNISGANLITANFFSGNGSLLTAITGANVTGTVSAATTAGTVTTNAQSNITSTGTLAGVTATGVVDLTGASNVSLGPVANVHISGGTSGYLLTTNGSGTLSWSAPASSTSIVNGTSNVAIGSSGGNVTTSVGGTANVLVVDAGGANITGNLSVSGTFTAGNFETSGASGNISGADYIIANYFQGNGSLLTGLNASNLASGTISSGILGNSTVYIGTTSVALNRSSGTQSLTGITSIDGYAATVSGAAQGNITSVGTLNGLTVTGTLNATGASNVSLGPVANVHISGGTSGYLLTTNGSGTLSWSAPASSTAIINGTSNVNIATSGGNVTTSVGGTANVLVVDAGGANVTGNLTVSGTFTAGNLTTSESSGNVSGANYVIANYFQGNGSFLTSITGANITGTVSAASVANTVNDGAQANITSVGTLTSVAVTGNATVGNVKINGGILSNRANIDVSTNTVIDEFAPGTYRTAKYVVSASSADGYQSAEIILVHNDSTAYISIYGSVCSNSTADIVEFSSNVNGVSGNVSVYATNAGAGAVVNVVATYLKT